MTVHDSLHVYVSAAERACTAAAWCRAAGMQAEKRAYLNHAVGLLDRRAVRMEAHRRVMLERLGGAWPS